MATTCRSRRAGHIYIDPFWSISNWLNYLPNYASHYAMHCKVRMKESANTSQFTIEQSKRSERPQSCRGALFFRAQNLFHDKRSKPFPEGYVGNVSSPYSATQLTAMVKGTITDRVEPWYHKEHLCGAWPANVFNTHQARELQIFTLLKAHFTATLYFQQIDVSETDQIRT